MSRPPSLIGVGVGPGDPELVTIKAVRILREADLVLVPVLSAAEEGRAEATVRAHVGAERVRRVVFTLGGQEAPGRREAAWDRAAQAVAAGYQAGASMVAFATIGDPNVYSTFTYLAATVRDLVPGVTVQTVPGITAMQDLAARSGTVLCEGTQTLALFPLTAGIARFEQALRTFDTVVGYKYGQHLPQALAAVRAAGRLPGAVYGASLGLPGQDIRPAAEVDVAAGSAPYLSTLLIPARRNTHGDSR